MAIILEAAYSKKLDLPNYSSHSYVVSIRTELSDLTQVEAESARLYALLQQSVDAQIRQVGFLPDGTTYGMHAADADHRQTAPSSNGDGHHDDQPVHSAPDAWTCSDKQKELILKLVEQHGLDKKEVEALAKERWVKSSTYRKKKRNRQVWKRLSRLALTVRSSSATIWATVRSGALAG